MSMLSRFAFALIALAAVLASPQAHAQSPSPSVERDIAPPPPPLTSALHIDAVGAWGRRPINVDALVAQLVDGSFTPPKPGDTLAPPPAMPPRRADAPDAPAPGLPTWRAVAANDKGEFGDDVRRGYLFFSVPSESEQVVMLQAAGHSVVYVNAEPHMGDPYAAGYMRLPILLRKGDNHLIFALAGRGVPFKAQLLPPRTPIEINAADLTTPDILPGDPSTWRLAVPLVNTTSEPRTVIATARPKGLDAGIQPLELTLQPLCVYKAPLEFEAVADATQKEFEIEILVRDAASGAATTAAVTLAVKPRAGAHKLTYVSEIDGSVQYASVVPPSDYRPQVQNVAPAPSPGLIVSLHGASVEAVNQADSYAAKPGLLILCPTNRRPFGFDWEDWGRLDAIEAMLAAFDWLPPDLARVYLTGHSMGGHGSWQLGVLFPDIFAAVAPSAGWLSFETYAGAPTKLPGGPDDDPRAALFRRAASTSDTIAQLPNFRDRSVYILHGDADDNVPVSEARRGRDELAKLGVEAGYHEQPAAGHWWDGQKPDAEPRLGPFRVACVDWPPIFEAFDKARNQPMAQRDRLRLRLNQPGPIGLVALYPVVIDQQRTFGAPSEVDLQIDRAARRVSGTTANVARLVLHADLFEPGPLEFQLDGAPPFTVPAGRTITLTRLGDAWSGAQAARYQPRPRDAQKSAERGGPFKSAFNARFTLVFSTGGSPEENAWSLAKARFDAEQWWCRANGAAMIMPDRDAGRLVGPVNVILYGNQQTNSAWARLLPDSPLRVERGRIELAGRELKGDDLAAVAVMSAPDGRLVGVVAGSGLPGMRATDRLPYFSSGVGFPDVAVFRSSIWREGLAAVEAAGYWSNQWTSEGGEFVWREAK